MKREISNSANIKTYIKNWYITEEEFKCNSNSFPYVDETQIILGGILEENGREIYIPISSILVHYDSEEFSITDITGYTYTGRWCDYIPSYIELDLHLEEV